MAATSAFDTRATRAGDSLYFRSPSDRVAQVWTVRLGDGLNKSVELPNGPRIRIATVPGPDSALLRRRDRAIGEIAVLTGWEGVRTLDGFDAAKKRFPTALEASLSDASVAPLAWREFSLSYSAAGKEEGKALAAAMAGRISKVSDPELRKPMAEALDAMAGGSPDFGDLHAELLGEIGKKHMVAIEQKASESKERTEKKREAFEGAVRTVDDANVREGDAMLGFQAQVAHTEGIARDNLAYFGGNGFLAFGPRFNEFLSAVNRNLLAVYPQADGPVALPKKLSEKDRALLAHGLVKSLGPDAEIAAYFEIPGYALKRADATGADVMKKIRAGLEKAGVLKDGGIRLQELESRLRAGLTEQPSEAMPQKQR
jgi:hypothetical protein